MFEFFSSEAFLSVIILDLVVVLEQVVILGHVIELFVTVQLLLVLKLIAILILLVIIAHTGFRLLHGRFFLDLLGFFKHCCHNLLSLDILVEEVQSIFNLLNFLNLAHQELIELQSILLDIRARLVNLIEE